MIITNENFRSLRVLSEEFGFGELSRACQEVLRDRLFHVSREISSIVGSLLSRLRFLEESHRSLERRFFRKQTKACSLLEKTENSKAVVCLRRPIAVDANICMGRINLKFAGSAHMPVLVFLNRLQMQGIWMLNLNTGNYLCKESC
jgi:hypothetical protein